MRQHLLLRLLFLPALVATAASRPRAPLVQRLALLAFCLVLTGTSVAAPRIMIVLSKEGGAYEEVVQAVRNSLAAGKQSDIELKSQALNSFRAADTYSFLPALIVTVGVEAARRVAEANPPVPILHTLVPRAAAMEILQNGRAGKTTTLRDSAIFLDQPIGRQLDLLRLALPRHKRVAVMLGPSTQHQLAELRTAARERSLTLEATILAKREDLLPALENLIDDNDVLLSVADPLVYHSETVHHILLTTYRYKIPVVGLSKAYVDAGALMAVYSAPDHIGRQIAEVVASLPLKGAVRLAAPQFPKYFLVIVNRRVAASLDLTIENENVLQHKLEGSPRPQ